MHTKQTDRRITTALTPAQAEAGLKLYNETMTAITAFAVGLNLLGYTHVQRNGCDFLSHCETCKRPYRTLVEKNCGRFWACPFCNSIESDC